MRFFSKRCLGGKQKGHFSIILLTRCAPLHSSSMGTMTRTSEKGTTESSKKGEASWVGGSWGYYCELGSHCSSVFYKKTIHATVIEGMDAAGVLKPNWGLGLIAWTYRQMVSGLAFQRFWLNMFRDGSGFWLTDSSVPSSCFYYQDFALAVDTLSCVISWARIWQFLNLYSRSHGRSHNPHPSYNCRGKITWLKICSYWTFVSSHLWCS